MTALILDASVAAAWILDDEREPRADAALARRHNAPLATLDAALAGAALAVGLPSV